MSDAIKCDLTGKLEEGAGVKNLDVVVSDNLMLRVTPMHKAGDKKYVQGVLSSKGVHMIEAAVATLQAAEFKAKLKEA